MSPSETQPVTDIETAVGEYRQCFDRRALPAYDRVLNTAAEHADLRAVETSPAFLALLAVAVDLQVQVQEQRRELARLRQQFPEEAN